MTRGDAWTRGEAWTRLVLALVIYTCAVVLIAHDPGNALTLIAQMPVVVVMAWFVMRAVRRLGERD